MNVLFSYKWLASHFEKDIPKPEEVAALFMKHLCEVEGMEKKGDDTIFDLKILPDRGHDLLAHRGIAHEISVLSGVPFSQKLKFESPKGEATELQIAVEDEKLCPRYSGRIVRGVKVGPSPDWLRERLESVGQRSINAVVDITNFVMLELGQPMHAFDLEKLAGPEIFVRKAKAGEQMTTLDDKELTLSPETLVIADKNRILAIAGVKGGKDAGVDEGTTAIVFEAANFDAVNTRKTSQRVGIRTDSSKRFEHGISPSLVSSAMEMATALLLEICPDAKVENATIVSRRPDKEYKVGIALSELNGILGTGLSSDDVANILKRLGYEYRIVKDPLAEVLARAKELVGKPYVLGASVLYDAPEKFDCSSLMAYLWKEVGVTIPRISVDQFVYSDAADIGAPKPGELVFANTGEGAIHHESKEWMPGTNVPEGVDHVGMYLGDGNVIHASRVLGGVGIEPLAQSTQFKNIVGVRRVAIPEESRFVATVPLERLDLRIKEDLAEELGRVYGFDKVPETPLGSLAFTPTPLKSYFYGNVIRDTLVANGFSEVFTYAFQENGAWELMNPIADDKKFLRANLHDGMVQALVLNGRNAPLLELDEIKLFEIGKVFPEVGKEELRLSLGVYIARAMKKKDEVVKAKLLEAKDALEKLLGVELPCTLLSDTLEIKIGEVLEGLPTPEVSAPFRSINTAYVRPSAYPFVLRDIALWVPEAVSSEEILETITKEAGELLVRKKLFDVFTKDFDGTKKTSYAFNLVFQSFEKTLSDEEVGAIMDRVTKALVAKGYEVR